MKSITSPSTAGRSLGLFFSLMLTGSLFAGPSAQQLDQQQRQRDHNTADAPAVAPVAPAPNMACSKCKTQSVEQFPATNPSGKLAPHTTTVGVSHDCVNCGGSITTIKGKTTNGMMDYCPVCAKTNPTCCSTKS